MWSYRVKIFDATSKRTPRIVKELHTFTSKFTTIKQLRHILSTELCSDLPASYNVGYYEGRHHVKKWLTTDNDLSAMNEKCASNNVYLWCEATQTDNLSRDRSPPRKSSSKRDDKEKEVDEIVKDLKERHPDDYSGPQLRLWARMISNGLHEDLDDPPRVPMITGAGPKRQKQESLTDALIGAANAFAKVFNPPSSTQDTNTKSVSSAIGLSPC